MVIFWFFHATLLSQVMTLTLHDDDLHSTIETVTEDSEPAVTISDNVHVSEALYRGKRDLVH